MWVTTSPTRPGCTPHDAARVGGVAPWTCGRWQSGRTRSGAAWRAQTPSAASSRTRLPPAPNGRHPRTRNGRLPNVPAASEAFLSPTLAPTLVVTDYERLGGSHQDDECAAEEWRKPRWWNRVHPGGAFPIVAGLAADRPVRGVPGSGLGHGSRGQGVVPGTR